MEIRIFKPTDYTAVLNLWTSTPGVGLRSLDDSEEGIRRFLARNPTTCFVAEEHRTLCGSVMSGHDGRRGFIYHACVHPDYRRKGIGSALVENALSALNTEGVTRAALTCFADNEAGRRFWESEGWSLRKDIVYYDMPVNANNI